MQKRVYYGYDGSNRLTSVTIDRSPSDGVITDNKTYITTYGYDGTSNRISSVVTTQNDGTGAYTTSNLAIAYVLAGSVYEVSSLTQTTAAGTSVTSFSYTAGQTTVTDPLGNVTTMVYDANGQLTRLISPPATTGATPQTLIFTYDANGNLLTSGPKWDPNFTNIALNWGDLAISDVNVLTTQSTEVDGGVNVYRRTTQTTPAFNTLIRLGQSGI